ncbi:MAG: hypothetical protein ACI4J7_10825 [Ruminiclostridium sp.]
MNENENKNTLVTDSVRSLSLLPRKRINLQKLFNKVSAADYAVMWFLSTEINEAEENRKYYLKQIAEASGLPMQFVSQMAGKLQDKGLAVWTHDGLGKDGTYIMITPEGMRALKEQSDILSDFRYAVVNKFGKERFKKLISEMSALDEIMNGEIEKAEETAVDSE